MAQLLHLDSEDPEQDINLYINSPGGSIPAMLAIYDTMRFVRADVATTAMGSAFSAATFLLATGAKGKRSALCPTRGYCCTSRRFRDSGDRPRTLRFTPGSSSTPSGG